MHQCGGAPCTANSRVFLCAANSRVFSSVLSLSSFSSICCPYYVKTSIFRISSISTCSSNTPFFGMRPSASQEPTKEETCHPRDDFRGVGWGCSFCLENSPWHSNGTAHLKHEGREGIENWKRHLRDRPKFFRGTRTWFGKKTRFRRP